MEINILDGPEKDFGNLISKLRKQGITDVYEKKDWLMVRQSEAVQVKVRHNGVHYEVKPLFPQIGNLVQVGCTILLWILLAYFSVPLSLVFAILLGQGISYAFYYPKIKKLRQRVGQII